jgi:hypothetical protein
MIPGGIAERLSRYILLLGFRRIDAVEADLQLCSLKGDGLHGISVRDLGNRGGDGSDGRGIDGDRAEDNQGREDTRCLDNLSD